MKGLVQILRGELEEDFIRFFIGAGWLSMALLALVTSFLYSNEAATGILLGGTISGLNSIGLEKDCRRAVRWGSMAAYFGGMSVRMALIALCVTVSFSFFREYFSPIGLFVGLSVGVVNFYILVLGMVAYKFRVKEA